MKKPRETDEFDGGFQPNDSRLTELVLKAADALALAIFDDALRKHAPEDWQLEDAVEDARRIYVTASRLMDAVGYQSAVEANQERNAADARNSRF